MVKNDVTAVVLSGGVGSRLGSDIPKQYIRVAEKMVITYALETLIKHPYIGRLYIAASEQWRDNIIGDLDNYNINTHKLVGFSLPGNNRQASIINSLNAIMNNGITSGMVLIHDAARPCISEGLITRLIEAGNDCDGVMPVLQVKDTVYVSNDGYKVSGLLDRNKLYAGQAPELFDLKKYYKANASLSDTELNRINGSTEPAFAAGMNIKIISGDESNIKITTKNDLERFKNSIIFKSNHEK